MERPSICNELTSVALGRCSMGENMIEPSTSPSKHLDQRRLRVIAVIVSAMAMTGLLLAFFQLFLRYDYVIDNHGGIWRIDRLTQQSCRVIHAVVHCGPLSSSKSVSKSFSISPSISTSVSRGRPK
jgi:hypothetical protein